MERCRIVFKHCEKTFLCTKNFSTSSTTHYFSSSPTCSGWQPSLHIGFYAPSALILGLFIITLALERLVNPWVHAQAEMERDFCTWYFPTLRKPIEVQSSADLVNVNLVKKLDLVKILMSPILVLIWSKITVDLVKKLDLVKVLVPPKNFTKSGLYCNIKL